MRAGDGSRGSLQSLRPAAREQGTNLLIERVDRLLQRISRGRLSVLNLAGLLSAQILVAGRKTGVVRCSTLQYVPDGDRLLLVASNWGLPTHPDWSANLMAAQQITIRLRGLRTVRCCVSRCDQIRVSLSV